MEITCDSTYCKNNDGNGFCCLEGGIYVSEAETGKPVCQNADYKEEGIDDDLD